MNLQLPPNISDRVQAYLDSGGFQNEDDVLRTALDVLAECDEDMRQRWHEGNRIALEQSRQGLSKLLDVEALLERAEQRVAAQVLEQRVAVKNTGHRPNRIPTK